mgnify:CR=1 FL=1
MIQSVGAGLALPGLNPIVLVVVGHEYGERLRFAQQAGLRCVLAAWASVAGRTRKGQGTTERRGDFGGEDSGAESAARKGKTARATGPGRPPSRALT